MPVPLGPKEQSFPADVHHPTPGRTPTALRKPTPTSVLRPSERNLPADAKGTNRTIAQGAITLESTEALGYSIVIREDYVAAFPTTTTQILACADSRTPFGVSALLPFAQGMHVVLLDSRVPCRKLATGHVQGAWFVAYCSYMTTNRVAFYYPQALRYTI